MGVFVEAAFGGEYNSLDSSLTEVLVVFVRQRGFMSGLIGGENSTTESLRHLVWRSS